MTIRRAVRTDADELAETAISAWREGFRGIVPERIDPKRAWRPDRIEHRLRAIEDGTEILAAEIGGRVRGMVMLGPSRDVDAEPREGEVVALYVHPDHWRRGIGRELVQRSLDRLRTTRHRQVIVWTLAESPRNLDFYDALGFHRDGGEQRRPSFGSPLEVRFRIRL